MRWFRRPDRRSGPEGPDALRARMVDRQIRARGVRDRRVLEAMTRIPRHLFLPAGRRSDAYADAALPIGRGQTISQPYIVAFMTEALEPADGLRALEVGTGSGYQVAVLADCGMEVWSMERLPELQRSAAEALRGAGIGDRVHLRLGDGSKGWPEEAPFDRILVTAAAPAVPRALLDQLASPGILVAPVGGPALQRILRVRRDAQGRLSEQPLEGARFVPLVVDEEGAG
ncbi:MAG: protein-L-isoaspartate(D-aspartate) O-methyltransferase [Candidatus Palauibacterales bacterium]|nr:protein-L-isoaspartate(D-aspartate) O-methyltransferase [Candidatus Palauibacterales bacterium]MDP2528380.1 protein-L-isoaspartate(D-aspartate) O-methyltransferase [Candidatus Palauibacterales bacterium]MDP2583764.1 protein-L-isoaspartate(D-aspartate) O-methyltransferase [Candidatus Palauibacterales bacterium]